MEKSEHKKIQNTKAALLAAITKLYKTTPVSEITVSALCKEASVNRTTFYKYYSVPMDVLEEKLSEIFGDTRLTLSENNSLPLDQYMYQVLLASAQMCYDNRKFLGMCHECNISFEKYLADFFAFSDASDNASLYKNIFISGGIGAIFAAWGKTGFKESPESVAGTLTELTLKLNSQ